MLIKMTAFNYSYIWCQHNQRIGTCIACFIVALLAHNVQSPTTAREDGKSYHPAPSGEDAKHPGGQAARLAVKRHAWWLSGTLVRGA